MSRKSRVVKFLQNRAGWGDRGSDHYGTFHQKNCVFFN
jgi:hypothetical protein